MGELPSFSGYEMQESLENILRALPDGMHIIEGGLSPKVMAEYQDLFRKQQKEKHEEAEDIEVPTFEELLQLSNRDAEAFKLQIIELGNFGDVQVFQLLQALYEELSVHRLWKEWLGLALRYCQSHIENEYLGAPMGFMATGLGGRGHRIRYCLAFATNIGTLFNEAKMRFAVGELEVRIEAKDGIIEECQKTDTYMLFMVLLPYKCSLLRIIKEFKEQCGMMLRDDFLVTNICRPDIEQIEEWAKDTYDETIDYERLNKEMELEEKLNFLGKERIENEIQKLLDTEEGSEDNEPDENDDNSL